MKSSLQIGTLKAGSFSVILAGCGSGDSSIDNPAPENTRPASFTDKQWLGKQLFFDTKLSEPAGQARAGYNSSQVGWTGPDELTDQGGAAYEGVVTGRFAIENRRRARMAVTAPYCISTLLTAGQAVCSGTAAPPA